ncbi:MAG: AarF/ABC1/UbiB kinase family protein [Bacteroidota bacterium]
MSQEKIAVSKLERAGKLVNAGAKVGANYMKHYAKRLINSDTPRTELEQENAKDIYTAFSELKGGPLKVAQMLSMGEQLLPKAYTQQFAQAQNKVDPLSYPLIRRTFRKAFGQPPEALFDAFSREAVNAASIGQVHKGQIDGQDYAIKLQYPGVATSLQSDLRLITPVATRILGLKKQEITPYLEEVERKLMEETDYNQELANAREIIDGCAGLDGLVFPEFREDLSNDRVLTMTWVDGAALSDWLKGDPSQEERNRIGQWLWDFYQHQIHHLHVMHADPHPGNFIITPEGQLGVIDFGCVKRIPEEFYRPYVQLLLAGIDTASADFSEALMALELLYDTDSAQDRAMILETFGYMFGLVGRPFYQPSFDFGDDAFFQQIYEQGEALSRDNAMRGLSARGSRHFIYFNRTYFGLYQLLNQLQAVVHTEVNAMAGV